jgi:hypothetical protein
MLNLELDVKQPSAVLIKNLKKDVRTFVQYKQDSKGFINVIIDRDNFIEL